LRVGEGLFVGIRISKQREDKTKEMLAKLSSGKSINNAADNAAGLTISESMRAQIRGLNQASINVQDTKSMLQTSDAESRISDVDMAKAMVAMIKEKLLGDVSLNIQAQSKVNAERVLEFLK